MTESTLVPDGRRYQLADLTLAMQQPWFAVHVHDEQSPISSWILSGEPEADGLGVRARVWLADVIQGIVADGDGRVWAITRDDQLITNSDLRQVAGWRRMDAHPQLPGEGHWYSRKISWHAADGERIELASCLAWVNDGLLIGTVSRCLYRWTSGEHARLEYEEQGVGAMGGVNSIVVTSGAVHALGYGGLLLRRNAPGAWQRLQGPWPEEATAFVNLIAGVEGPAGALWVVAAGGSVIHVSADEVGMLAQVPGEPLGICRFQQQWFVSTLDGCYELCAEGEVALVRRGVLMGKSIASSDCLIAFDAEPPLPDSAGVHLWLRSRTRDRWVRQLLCRA